MRPSAVTRTDGSGKSPISARWPGLTLEREGAMASSSVVWHDWLWKYLRDGWVTDVFFVSLGTAKRSLRQHLIAFARQSGQAVRKMGPWRPRRDHRGIWKLLRLADLPHLPDLKIRMQWEWTFSSKLELKVFLHQAAVLRANNGLEDWIIFCAVALDVHRQPRPSIVRPEALCLSWVQMALPLARMAGSLLPAIGPAEQVPNHIQEDRQEG